MLLSKTDIAWRGVLISNLALLDSVYHRDSATFKTRHFDGMPFETMLALSMGYVDAANTNIPSRSCFLCRHGAASRK